MSSQSDGIPGMAEASAAVGLLDTAASAIEQQAASGATAQSREAALLLRGAAADVRGVLARVSALLGGVDFKGEPDGPTTVVDDDGTSAVGHA